MKKHFFLIALVFFAITSLHSQTKQNKFSIYDWLELDFPGSISFSPSGKEVLYIVNNNKVWDKPAPDNIWIISLENGNQKQLTQSKKDDSNAKWSPDGKTVAFVSSRNGEPQVYTIEIDGGEAKQITETKEGVHDFQWVNEKSIAYLTYEPRDSIIVKAEAKAGGGYVVGTTFRKSNIYVLDIDTKSKTKVPFLNHYISEFSCSKDGKYFGLIVSKNSDLYNVITQSKYMLIDDRGNIKYEFSEGKFFTMPKFSPMDNKVSFAVSTVGYSSRNSIFVYNLKNSKLNNLTEEFDPTVESYQWVDEENIVFNTPRNVYHSIYKVNQNKKIETILKSNSRILEFSVNKKINELVVISGKVNQPYEIFSHPFGKKGKKINQLTHFNDDKKKLCTSTSKVINYHSTDSTIIEAVVTYPPTYDKNKKFPLVVIPHGGPDGISMNGFEFFGSVFSQAGYIVFEPNFRGSIGYGVDFYKANQGKIGYVDYEDIMSGVDYLIKTDAIDTTKMVVGGWSFGGYMTNWIIGQTNRFKAAVSVASISNTVSMYGQSDINHGEIAVWEFDGVPVKNMENYTRSSPINYLEGCKTPTLIMHGEKDKRVPAIQAWEMYRALGNLGVKTKLVLYPNAGHGIGNPKQNVDVFNRWLKWYETHLEN